MNAPGREPAHRYLRYDELRPMRAGFNHMLSNLECILREAHASGRLALLPALNLAPHHNFGIDRDWRWDAYIDLAESQLLGSAGKGLPLPLVRSLPKRELPALTLKPGEPMPERAADFPLVVRRIRSTVFRKDVPFTDGPPWFAIQPSRRVLDLAAPVVTDLLSRGDGRFVAIHIRRGDRLAAYPPRLTAPDAVGRHLREQGIADDSVVYALSDEHDADYWRRMARLPWKVVRHADYPALSDLLCRDDGRVPDNYLLYAVEKRIMAAATIRIETLGRGKEGNADSALVDRKIWLPRWLANERTERRKRILFRPAVTVARRLGLLGSGSTSSG